MRPTSLAARLIAAVVLLVALVCFLIATLTTLAVGNLLDDQLDTKVSDAHDRAIGALRGGVPPVGSPRPDRPNIRDPRGQDAGTLTAYLTQDASGGILIADDGERTALDDEVVAELDDLRADGRARTVTLPGLGEYRVVGSGVRTIIVITGYPTRDRDETVDSLVRWELLFSGLGVLVAGGAALVVVRRQLRPLREVARTAHDVAALPLATGAVGVTSRVPDHLTDDRTEVGQVGAALNTLLGHMESALDARHRSELQVRQFVADASHELRTPLTTIQGYAELSLRAGQPADLTHAMGKVKAESDRMRSLVEDLLLLARLDAGRPLDRADVDLTRLALESVQDARVIAPDHRWLLDLEAEAVTVTGDEQRLHQVLGNLLTNARRHTPAGTTVTVSVRRDGAAAVLRVADDGPGIPDDLRPVLFERFARGDSARARASGGVGLGLSLARAIAEAHGGTLDLDLDLDLDPGKQGSAFTLILPA